MPASVMIGLLGLLVAVVSYTVGTWMAFRRKRFDRSSLTALWLGFAFDVIATASMAMTIGRLDFSPDGWLHTTLALGVMAGMLLFASLGTYAVAKGNEQLSTATARAVVVPWALWVAVFVWGLADKMPRR